MVMLKEVGGGKRGRPELRTGVLDIHPYVPGASAIEGRTDVIKLASNESPFGPSPMAVEAAADVLPKSHLYPDGGSAALRNAIGAAYDIDPGLIVCGSGSEQLLSYTAGLYVGSMHEVIQSEYGFLAYGIVTRAFGGTLVSAKEDNYTTDVDAMLEAVTERTKVVFLANPNNPTGTMIAASEMRRLREGLPDHVLLVIDAAYAEYVDHEAYTAGHELVAESIENGTENTMVTHTFSKIYGLAGLRVGWCYAPPTTVDAMNRVRSVFNVTSAGQAAAVAALADPAHIVTAKAHNNTALPMITAALRDMGLRVPDSCGNFVLAFFPGGPEQSQAADKHLQGDGLIVRPVGGYGLKDALRITIGSEPENAALLKSLGAFMAG